MDAVYSVVPGLYHGTSILENCKKTWKDSKTYTNSLWLLMSLHLAILAKGWGVECLTCFFYIADSHGNQNSSY